MHVLVLLIVFQAKTSVDNNNSWEDRVSRRLKRIQDAVSNQNDGVDLNRLHKTLTSLENELLWRKAEGL